MKYISKGMVVKASTENILTVTRCGADFQLTELMADLWLNARFGFSELKPGNILADKALQQLKRQELVETADDEPAGEYRALTQCIITPALSKKTSALLSREERRILKWLIEAGLRLSMAELVFLEEHHIEPTDALLGKANLQKLTERIYTQETIFDNVLEAQMEHSSARDSVVRTVLSLLKKKRIILL